MSFYLTAFIFQGYGSDDKSKIIRRYNTFDDAKNKLEMHLKEKESQNWEIIIYTNEEINELQGNVEFFADAKQPDTINSVMYAISPEATIVTNEGVLFEDFVDITKEAMLITTTDQGFEEIPPKASCAGNVAPNSYTHNKIIIACSIATILGFLSLPYGYYTLLKVLFFGSLIYFAFEYQRKNEFIGSALIVLSVLIILYNPMFPVMLGSKPLWILVNVGTIGYLYWLAGEINLDNKKIKSVGTNEKYS